MKVSCVGRGLMGYLGNKVKNLMFVTAWLSWLVSALL
jgi:hypothetical protein